VSFECKREKRSRIGLFLERDGYKAYTKDTKLYIYNKKQRVLSGYNIEYKRDAIISQ